MDRRGARCVVPPPSHHLLLFLLLLHSSAIRSVVQSVGEHSALDMEHSKTKAASSVISATVLGLVDRGGNVTADVRAANLGDLDGAVTGEFPFCLISKNGNLSESGSILPSRC